MKRNRIPLLLLPLLAVLTLPFLSLPAHAEETIVKEAIREAETELLSEKEEALATVNSLTFLAEEEKESYRIGLNEVYSNALTCISDLTDIDEIFHCKENAALNLSLKKQEAIQRNLGLGKESYLSLFATDIESLHSEVSLQKYLSKSQKETFYSSIKSYHTDVSLKTSQASSENALSKIHAEFLLSIIEIRNHLQEENRLACIQKLTENLEAELSNSLHRLSLLSYLSSDEKSYYEASLRSQTKQALEGIASARSTADMELLFLRCQEASVSLFSQAELQDLTNAKYTVKNEILTLHDQAVGELKSLASLPDLIRLQAQKSLSEKRLSSYQTAEDAKTALELSTILSEFNEYTHALLLSVAKENLRIAKEEAILSLETHLSSLSPSSYASDRYARLESLCNAAINRIQNAITSEQVESALAEALSSMTAIPSLLEEAVDDAKRELEDAYRLLLEKQAQYAEEELARLHELYENTLQDLSVLPDNTSPSSVALLTKSRISSMKALPLCWISCGDLTPSSSGNESYPSGFSPTEDGLWGTVTSSHGLSSQAFLSIRTFHFDSALLRTLKNIAAENRISYFGSVPQSGQALAEWIKNAKGITGLRISLTQDGLSLREFEGSYRVRILLPSAYRGLGQIKVLYLCDDGSAEFYDATVENGFLEFDTEHFSDFLLLCENRIVMTPLLLLLTLIGITELIAVIFLSVWRRKQKSRLYAIAPFALVKFTPSFAIPALIALLLLDIALGVAFVLLLRKILGTQKGKREKPALPAAVIEALSLSAAAPIPSFSPVQERPSLAPPTPLASVSAEEADLLADDHQASLWITPSRTSSTVCRGCRKTPINLDTVSENFFPGDVVCLETLKEKGLIPGNACFLKVLARGTLDKPLTIRAQSFSAPAVKMIVLTGGEAILEGALRNPAKRR